LTDTAVRPPLDASQSSLVWRALLDLARANRTPSPHLPFEEVELITAHHFTYDGRNLRLGLRLEKPIRPRAPAEPPPPPPPPR
jgi:hypothetical protein